MFYFNPRQCHASHSCVYKLQEFLPYARTELVIDSQSHTYLRRIVFRVPRDLSRKLMILVRCTHTHTETHTQRHKFMDADARIRRSITTAAFR
jgi:hypothetical protein